MLRIAYDFMALARPPTESLIAMFVHLTILSMLRVYVAYCV